MGESKIIVVANQKGGVGKSTLCMLLANYLSKYAGVDIGAIIDTDAQCSVNEKRKEDLEIIKGNDLKIRYKVHTLPLSEHGKINDLVKQLRDCGKSFIIDTPGTLNNEGILTFLTHADYILCPFYYDDLSLSATTKFLIFRNNFKEKIKAGSGTVLSGQIILVPCRKTKNVGTKVEMELWGQIRSSFEKLYKISPEIPGCAELRRSNTIDISPGQFAASSDALRYITEIIYSSVAEGSPAKILEKVICIIKDYNQNIQTNQSTV